MNGSIYMVFAVTELTKRDDKPRKGKTKRTFLGLFSDQKKVKHVLRTDPEPHCDHYMVYWCVLDRHNSDPTNWLVTKDGEWL